MLADKNSNKNDLALRGSENLYFSGNLVSGMKGDFVFSCMKHTLNRKALQTKIYSNC